MALHALLFAVASAAFGDKEGRVATLTNDVDLVAACQALYEAHPGAVARNAQSGAGATRNGPGHARRRRRLQHNSAPGHARRRRRLQHNSLPDSVQRMSAELHCDRHPGTRTDKHELNTDCATSGDWQLCCGMYLTNPTTVVGRGWGSLSPMLQDTWSAVNCDRFIRELRRAREQGRCEGIFPQRKECATGAPGCTFCGGATEQCRCFSCADEQRAYRAKNWVMPQYLMDCSKWATAGARSVLQCDRSRGDNFTHTLYGQLRDTIDGLHACGLPSFLAYGTLIGAIRDHGMNPLEVDNDVAAAFEAGHFPTQCALELSKRGMAVATVQGLLLKLCRIAKPMPGLPPPVTSSQQLGPNDPYTDLYTVRFFQNFQRNGALWNGEISFAAFGDRSMPVPGNAIALLDSVYTNKTRNLDWRIPITKSY